MGNSLMHDWQVSPQAKRANPEVAYAYRAKTLNLIILNFRSFHVYSWTTQPSITPELLRADPFLEHAYLLADETSVVPYPYKYEARKKRNG